MELFTIPKDKIERLIFLLFGVVILLGKLPKQQIRLLFRGRLALKILHHIEGVDILVLVIQKVLDLFGVSGSQGSLMYWCFRHRFLFCFYNFFLILYFAYRFFYFKEIRLGCQVNRHILSNTFDRDFLFFYLGILSLYLNFQLSD